MPKKVFITGASGCVGHYLIEELLAKTDYELYLLVRDRRKLQINLSDRPNVHVIEIQCRISAITKTCFGQWNLW